MAAYTSRYKAETRSNIQKEKQISDESIFLTIQGHVKDMIAADFRYHKSCMDKFRSRHGERAPTLVGDDAQNSMYDKAFSTLASEINDPIFKDRSTFYITELCDRYREILQGIGADNAMSYRMMCKLCHKGECQVRFVHPQ